MTKKTPIYGDILKTFDLICERHILEETRNILTVD